MIARNTSATRQRGAVTLIMALVVLVALALLTLVGAWVALTKTHLATNTTQANAAFAAANAGIQSAEAYLIANKAQVSSTAAGGWLNTGSTQHWQSCSTGDTAPPCGDGTKNLYDDSWQYYGPVEHLPAPNGNDTYKVWYLSNNLNKNPQPLPWTDCQQLSLLSGGSTLPILSQVGALAGGVVDRVNNLLGIVTGQINNVLGTLVGQSNILPENFGIPDSLCLPINFTQASPVPPPSRINPTLYIQAQAETLSDGNGAEVQIQQAMQATSIYVHAPLAAIMVNGDANLVGDVRVWGNPRPPTVSPDFSTLNLDNLNPLGLPVNDLVNSTLAPLTSSLAPLVAPLLDPVLAEQLDTDSTTLLSLNANVTFPLSIWADGAVKLAPLPAQPWQINTEDSGGLLGGLLNTLGLHGLAGGLLNGLDSLLDNVLCLLPVTCAPPTTAGMIPNLGLLLNSARTCLPQWPGDESPAPDGAQRDACTPLSQTFTVAGQMTAGGRWKEKCKVLGILDCHWEWSQGSPEVKQSPLSIPLKLPDVQDDSLTLQTVLEGLLRPGTNPVFPSDLFDYIFGTPEAQAADEIKPKATVAGGCGGLNATSNGLYWITGDCAPSGDIGSRDKPIILIMQGGTLTLSPGSTVNGVVYMMGDANNSVISAAGGDRATIRGGLIVDGKLQMQGPINVVYDKLAIRAAGFLAGSFARIPGSWNDQWSGP